MADFDFGDIDFGSVAFDDVDFTPKVPPPVVATLVDQSVYPPDARSPLFLDWSPEEEDVQLAALGWMLLWRKSNTLKIEGRTASWIIPPADPELWNALKERMIDWAFLEKGDLDLDATWTMLQRRHQVRLAITPQKSLNQMPTSVGTPRKETPNVGKPQQSDPHRKPGQRPRVKDDPVRYGAVQILDSDD